jgi:hypothetical protein
MTEPKGTKAPLCHKPQLINNNIECLRINFKTKRYHKKRRKREKHQSFDVRNMINQALLN